MRLGDSRWHGIRRHREAGRAGRCRGQRRQGRRRRGRTARGCADGGRHRQVGDAGHARCAHPLRRRGARQSRPGRIGPPRRHLGRARELLALDGVFGGRGLRGPVRAGGGTAVGRRARGRQGAQGLGRAALLREVDRRSAAGRECRGVPGPFGHARDGHGAGPGGGRRCAADGRRADVHMRDARGRARCRIPGPVHHSQLVLQTGGRAVPDPAAAVDLRDLARGSGAQCDSAAGADACIRARRI